MVETVVGWLHAALSPADLWSFQAVQHLKVRGRIEDIFEAVIGSCFRAVLHGQVAVVEGYTSARAMALSSKTQAT